MSNESRNDTPRLTSTRTCLICAQPFLPRGRAVYCGDACRQHAFRLRQRRDRELLQMDAAAPLRRRQRLVQQTIYECPRCLSQYFGERRCPECNLMCRRIGLGAECPHCSEPILLADLLDGVQL